ncbi:MAG: hypothetical protein O3A80_03080 [bacterium]|nr:hypothetical protein [bacterium]
MSKTNTSSNTARYAALQSLIDRSVLLTPEQKEQAQVFAEQSGEEGRDALSAFLQTESGVVQTLVSDSVRSAASQGDGAAVTKKFDEFFRQSDRYLRQSKEGVERGIEVASAEHLLDAS